MANTNPAFSAGVQYARDWLTDNFCTLKVARCHFINVASDLEPEEPDMALEGMLSVLREAFSAKV